MGKLHLSIGTIALTAALAACDSEAATAPPPTPTVAPSTTAPAPSASPTPPVMPEAAKAHTKAGAEAFVRYYFQLVDYTQSTLDTHQISAVSDPSCDGCQAGIAQLNDRARQRATIHGGSETLSAVVAAPVTPDAPVTVWFKVTNTRQKILIPGKKSVIHPQATVKEVMSLIPVANGWLAGELRAG